jgi:phosphoserine phosphatase
LEQEIAVLDWDGTMRPGFTIEAWVERLRRGRLISKHSAEEIERTKSRYNAGLLAHDEFAIEAARVYATSLRGRTTNAVRRVAERFVEADAVRLNRWSRSLVAELRRHSIGVVVVSGAPEEILEVYMERLRLDAVYGLKLAARQGKYSGSIRRNPGASGVKGAIIDRLVMSNHRRIRLALGNSGSDMPLFSASPVSIIVDDDSLTANGRTFHIRSETPKDVVLGIVRSEVLHSRVG